MGISDSYCYVGGVSGESPFSGKGFILEGGDGGDGGEDRGE
jgi:hypothetical protein